MANIHFKSVEYKNFLSTGNVSNKIILDKSRTTLIMGKNGEGKSTILDAITFCLFGKPFRDIKLGQLVNSINGKHCLTTVEFSIGNRNYKVIRGMKPNIFEIYCDDVVINQDAASKDYQRILEQQILRLNYKTFTQVVILGSASFVPFMQLKSAQRREVVEDILDIRIFSVMNQLLKDRISITKDAILRIESDISVAKSKVESQQAIIKTLKDAKEDVVNSLVEKINSNSNEIQDVTNKIDSILADIQSLIEHTQDKSAVEEIKKVNSLISKYTSSNDDCNNHIHFFNENNVCVTCEQEISDEYKSKVIATFQEKIETNNNNLDTLEKASKQLQESIQYINDINSQITDKNILLSSNRSIVSMLTKQNDELHNEIESVKNNTTNVDEERNKLKELAKVTVDQINQKTTLLETRELQSIASLLLKDTGIKTAIIREYLPVMNTLINKYLAIMDTYIKFELDESFNETIKSRFRDEFTYASFSEGEKKKIDVAILFTWRQVAKLKNSVNTNLLILDEIFDGPMDANSTELLLQLLNEVSKDSNIFCISHKGDILNDKFHSILKIEKRNDFSVIV